MKMQHQFLAFRPQIGKKGGKMSKTSKNKATTTLINLGGKTKVRTTTDDGVTISNYVMSPWEKLAYEYAQKEFAQNIDNINVFSEDTLKSLSDQIEAYTQSGIKKIDEIYSPMIKDLQNDIASRFGNLDNSIFLDKLSDIEGKRADSVAALSEDIKSRESELIDNELEKRYNYLNFLNDYQSQMLSNALGTSTKSASNSYSNYARSNSYENLSNDLENITKKVILSLFNL